MKKDSEQHLTTKKRLVLRKESIKALDNADLLFVAGAATTLPPPDGGHPTDPT